MKRMVFTVLVVGCLAGCATSMPKLPQTQLQIREYQTRTYQTNDSKIVMKVLIDVFQDRGYTVKNASTDLGFIQAEKQVFIENPGEVFAATFWAGAAGRWKVTSVVETTANVSLAGTSTSRVRCSFVHKITDNHNVPMNVNTDPGEKSYQEFFAYIDKGLFIQSELLSTPIPGLSNIDIGTSTGKLSEWESGKFEEVKQEETTVLDPGSGVIRTKQK